MTSSPGGFIRGTPVWSDPTIVPIDQLHSGENQPGSVNVGKRELVALTYALELHSDRSGVTFAASDQAFDVEGRGWVTAASLKEGDKLLCREGPPMLVQLAVPVYTTGRDGVGWYSYSSLTLDTIGNVIDFNGPVWDLLKSHVSRPGRDPGGSSRIAIDVFQLHTDGEDACYVGSKGLRVASSASRASEPER